MLESRSRQTRLYGSDSSTASVYAWGEGKAKKKIALILHAYFLFLTLQKKGGEAMSPYLHPLKTPAHTIYARLMLMLQVLGDDFQRR